MSLSEAPGTAWSGYGAGLVLSVAAHLGVAVLIVTLLQPGPVQDQPQPRSEIHIETQAVQQSEVKPQAAKGERAAAASASGAAAAQGTVKESKAQPAALPLAVAKADTAAAPAAPQAAPPAPIKPAAPQAPAAVQGAAPAPVKAEAPPGQTVAASAPAPQPITAAAPPATALAALAPPPPVQALTATATPIAAFTPTLAPTAPATPSATPLAAAQNAGESAAAVAPKAQTVAAAPATGQHMTATLAWSGAGGALDPVSLKAIASFMRPGDTAAQADAVHDGLSAILNAAPCSRLQAEFDPATGSLKLRGHVPDPAMKAPILAALQAQLGSGITVDDALMILPRPQCGALTGIADVGLPQSQDQLTNPRLIGPDAQARTFAYVKGQRMELQLAAPDYDAFVYVDFFDADGNVIHLIPNDQVPLISRPAKSTFFVGKKQGNQPALSITIGPPYGQEIAAAFAASAPLYDGLRPMSEPAGPYLDWLKTKVAAARAKDPAFKGEWVYFMVSTKAQ